MLSDMYVQHRTVHTVLHLHVDEGHHAWVIDLHALYVPVYEI